MSDEEIPEGRFPFAPVVDHLVLRLGGRWSADSPDGYRHRFLAELLDIDRATVRRWATVGHISEETAELIASVLHEHPCHLWGDRWWAEAGVGPDLSPQEEAAELAFFRLRLHRDRVPA